MARTHKQPVACQAAGDRATAANQAAAPAATMAAPPAFVPYAASPHAGPQAALKHNSILKCARCTLHISRVSVHVSGGLFTSCEGCHLSTITGI